MSMSYFRLREPIAALHVNAGALTALVEITIVGGRCAGALDISLDDLGPLLRLFADRHGAPILRTSWGGKAVGTVVCEQWSDPPPDGIQLISEYGELLTAGEIRARAGAGRGDDLPPHGEA